MPDPINKPLLYTNPMPLDTDKHRDAALKRQEGLDFARTAHAVPANVVEFPQLCHSYPIVFSPDETATAVAILGLREGENLFLDKAGRWADEATYIPSYIRRYPFIFAEVKGSDQLTLCVDDAPGVLDSASDLKLFGADGKPTALTNNALEFCKSFHAAAQQSREFCAAIAASGLLVEREAEIPLPDKQVIRFGGFRIVDEEKWAKLDEKTLLDWKKRGWLAPLYAHLFSGAQWLRLARLHMRKSAA